MKKLISIMILSVMLFSCQKKRFAQVDTNVEETCVDINELSVILNSNEVWELQSNGEQLFYFPNFAEAATTKYFLEQYGAKEHCSCGNGTYTTSEGEEAKGNEDHIMMYQKTTDLSGIGNNERNSYDNGVEDCLPFNPKKLVAKQDPFSFEWYLIEKPGHSMFAFGKDKDACINALKVIKKYGYNQSCFVGRAMASFSYLKRYREDFETIPEFSIEGERLIVTE